MIEPLASRIDRRAAVVGLAALGSAFAAAAWRSDALAADAPPRHPWIDAHSHIWTRDVAKFPLAAGATVNDLAPPSFTAEELLEVARRHDVGRVVLIQHHRYHGWDNAYLVDAARRFPQAFRVVGMVDNFAADAVQTMERLLPRRVTGLRITPWVYKDKWLGGEMDALWRAAARTGQAMCCLIDPQHLPAVEGMCRRFPDTSVVIDHFARIGADGEIRSADVDALCGLAKHKRVTVKISAYYALGKKRPPYLDLVPMIRRVLDAYGPERCMWASDSPYQIDGDHTYAASLELARDKLADLSAGDRDWLLRKTAERTYFF